MPHVLVRINIAIMSILPKLLYTCSRFLFNRIQKLQFIAGSKEVASWEKVWES